MLTPHLIHVPDIGVYLAKPYLGAAGVMVHDEFGNLQASDLDLLIIFCNTEFTCPNAGLEYYGALPESEIPDII